MSGASRLSEPVPMSSERLLSMWNELNARYFHRRLPPIPIVWSGRLTASVGMFVSQVGPRTAVDRMMAGSGPRRVIRLSIPLLHEQPDSEIVGTLAHEMIHQWQYDVLKRRPDHGPDFVRLMAIMNHDRLGITIRHNLDGAVHALTKYTWRCQDCGRDYHRQRRTIRPRHHRCGACSGRLREIVREIVMGPMLVTTTAVVPPKQPSDSSGPSARARSSAIQLSLPL